VGRHLLQPTVGSRGCGGGVLWGVGWGPISCDPCGMRLQLEAFTNQVDQPAVTMRSHAPAERLPSANRGTCVR
jgi:hypothetical protein